MNEARKRMLSACSADVESAVAPNSIRQQSSADWKSAIQEIGSLRYGL